MAQPWELVARLRPKVAARAAETDRTGEFPTADFADLRAAGLFGLFTPSRLGGLGRDYADYARVAFELARGNGATALVFNMHASVTGALAAIPDELARSLGVAEEFFVSRDRILADAAAGAFYAVAMS
jgi:alkylation response protein AidB-like acyl-CoA dehydrogenase